jgi:hypothetical protein
VAEIPKPGDFFIGIAEFFGSLAPGTVLVALLWRLGTVPGFSNQPRDLLGFQGAALVAALIVGGYLAGNLVSVLGSTLDRSYDAVRKLRYPLARDKAYQAAKAIRDVELGGDAPMNTFQWARAVLAIEHRDAFDEVIRLEAASKLFRSMVVVSFGVAAAAAFRFQRDQALAGVAAAVLSFWPYVDRRYKSTEAAYRLVIVLRSRPRNAKREAW